MRSCDEGSPTATSRASPTTWTATATRSPRAWEIHDTRHVLSWAIGDVEGHTDLDAQVTWLARVLQARNFPLEHLATNLELAADVTRERISAQAHVAERLQAAADLIRRTPAFR